MQSPSPERQFKAKVTENLKVSKGHFLMSLRPLKEVKEPKPGQFYMVGTGESNDPLLKRPFCFFKKHKNAIQILYRVRGKGTTLLSRMKPGDVLDLVGPLGNAWPKPGAKNIPLIVAGGIGIASVFPLAASLKRKPLVIYGGRNRDELLMLDELNFVYSGIHPATEDGSFGKKGTVMDVLKSLAIKDNYIIYACGPKGMLKAVAEFAEKKGLKGYASLEEKMACGMGACLGCAVKTKKGIKEVCIDGPVFKFEDIDWE
jgi:dihydroorotate dehydrogenase electron transfer subunit